jgi:hypothetical protein
MSRLILDLPLIPLCIWLNCFLLYWGIAKAAKTGACGKPVLVMILSQLLWLLTLLLVIDAAVDLTCKSSPVLP